MKGNVTTTPTFYRADGAKPKIGYTFHLLSIIVISLLCVIIYSNVLNSPFVFDDAPNIEKNPYIRLTRIDFQKLYDAGFKSLSKNRPVANISFALNYYFGKYDVTGYHIVNIIIHLINGILVYFLSLVIFIQTSCVHNQNFPLSSDVSIPLMSVFAALIFISHPVQTQSVTYIVQRMNGMATMFCLLSLLLYISGRMTRTKWRNWLFFSGCFVSWIMALGSKEIAATLPFVIIIYEWYFFQDLQLDWIKRNIKYLFVPVVLFLLVAFIYLEQSPFDKILASYANRDFTILERVLTQFRIIVFYISLLLAPHPSRLNLLHHVTTSQSLLIPFTTLLSMLVIAGIIGLAIYIAGKHRLISFCILWFFINLFIESSVYGLEMIFEHRLYLPMFGFVILVISSLFQLLTKRRFWLLVAGASIVLFLSTFTYIRNGVWQNSITLWADVVSKNPQSYRANHNLGVVLKEQGRHKEAIHYFSKALRIKPEFAEIHNNLGFALMEQGRLKEATEYFSEALEINPDYAEAHNNMGTALASQGRLKEAVGYFSKAVQIKPNYAEAHNNMGTALKEQGKLTEAIGYFSEALRIDPEFAGAYNNMGTILSQSGKFKEAMYYFSKA